LPPGAPSHPQHIHFDEIGGFGDLVGKLEVLHVECDCGRRGQYGSTGSLSGTRFDSLVEAEAELKKAEARGERAYIQPPLANSAKSGRET
jgi:hypothetical protein